MKALALDVGDAWTGTALSDDIGLTARPYQTIATGDLYVFLEELLKREPITTIIIGYPITMKGTQSAQTHKVLALKDKLQRHFSSIEFKLFDERMTSKQAAHIKPAKNKQDKLASHSLAAALILSTYLMLASSSRPQ